ncbi:3-deoxy-D-manno-octulosonic acid transferase [Seonamhaeicola aphaedonensis]|uniref:3-deoxy-D-manno-octulosonic acid transferase n=1 Tax=Seonamhaeicola aphaedonensis TaxID=1461338 RepID=A0A3D9HLQ7_9FLAO|nr:glycosyltransferase N-terminal domain-containing protein [Seonamhaeicola aphaedonensis]RED50408.1 3-deoxy-D-manno-octulosonic-acid transferase [Seonamhaeicola aphaedonensis]
MSFLYNIGINFTNYGLKCVAHFNQKIKLGVYGRAKTFYLLENSITKNDKTLWFHCASLGEYEQGLPVFKALRKHYVNHKIVLSFFSPSGFEIRKNSPIADLVVYLPIDTPKNAKRFLDIVNPVLTIFVKYDIWPNFLNTLKKRQLKAILISASFRRNQSYFKFYGKNLRKALFAFQHIFTQNEISKTLLNSINYKNVTVSGDTRFDRVLDQLKQDNTLDFVEEFKANKVCVVAGSTWPEGEAFFIDFINSNISNELKFIIAPHNIKSNQINSLKEKLHTKTVLFSEKENENLREAQIFIIDTVGILSKIYSYASIAYVGGALGNTGLHNTLEPAVFGVPIIIGNHHHKFPEAKAMIDKGGMFSVSNHKDFTLILNKLAKESDFRVKSGSKNREYIEENKGAVIQILNYLRI